MRFTRLSLAAVYLSIATLTNPVWATTIAPVSQPKPIPIACYIQIMEKNSDNYIWVDRLITSELAAGNFNRVMQLIPVLKLTTLQQLNIRSAIIRQAIAKNRIDVIETNISQVVQLNSQYAREQPAYANSIDFWSLPLSLAQALIAADTPGDRLRQRQASGVVLLKYVETTLPQASANNSIGTQSNSFPAPEVEIIYNSPLLIQIADLYIRADRLAEAIVILQKFQKYPVTIKKIENPGFSSYLLARSYLQAKQPKIALKLLTTSHQQATSLTNLERQISLLVAIAKTYRAAGKPELAIQVLQQSVQIATKSSDVNLTALSLALLSNTASELGEIQLTNNLANRSIQLVKQVPRQEQSIVWLGIANHLKKPAQREQLVTVLKNYQNLATSQTRTTILRNIFQQWLKVAEYERAIPVARELINIAKKNSDAQALTDIINPYVEGNLSSKARPILPEFVVAVQSLTPLASRQFDDDQLNESKSALLGQITRIYLELRQLDLAISFAKIANDSSFNLTRQIVIWLADKQQFEQALIIVRSLPVKVQLTARERELNPTASYRSIRSGVLDSLIKSAIQQGKLDFAQKLVAELADPNYKFTSSIDLATAYLFTQNNPIAANRILKTLKPKPIYQRAVDDLHQLANCAID
jgi:tetratricopeptide (TPR) repeat protein